MAFNPELQAIIAKARAEIAARQPQGAALITQGKEWNPEQQDAIDRGVRGESFVLIGAAGTGKTTTLKGLLHELITRYILPPLDVSTKFLAKGAPGIALVSYTRRAVRQVAKQMPPELKGSCITIHKLLEYQPERYLTENEAGEEVEKTRFAPARNRLNRLPSTLRTIVIDESSMVDVDLFERIIDALPDPSAVQFIFLGDLNQLPPVYGQAILGFKMLELPIVQLTRVYRQALESPIISLATAVRTNRFRQFSERCVAEFGAPAGFDAKELKIKDAKGASLKDVRVVLENPGHGKVTLHPWKQKFSPESALHHMQQWLIKAIDDGVYSPDDDMVLCPWNTSFGTIELNKAIAQALGKKRGATVFHIIAGYNSYFFAVGDRVMVDKQDAIITEILPNRRYLGKEPKVESTTLDRWGIEHGGEKKREVSDEDVDALFDRMAEMLVEDRVAQASHIIKYRFIDDDPGANDIEITGSVQTAAEINAMLFGYAITVHKAQGSECRKVFLLTSHCHSKMLSRELVYTAITRASRELYIFCSPLMLATAGNRPQIKGDTLAEKLEFFKKRKSERLDRLEAEESEE